MMAYNFARRLKTLKGLTPYEYICKIWTKEPERFNVNPFLHIVGLNTYYLCQEKGCASYGKSVSKATLENAFETLLTSITPPAALF